MAVWALWHLLRPRGATEGTWPLRSPVHGYRWFVSRGGLTRFSVNDQNACDPRRPLNFQNKPMRPAMMSPTTRPSQLFALVFTLG